MDHPDYASLDLPDHKEKADWEWQHRRAYVYQELIEAGHHTLVNKKALAEKFDVTRKTIYADIDKISEYMVQQIDTTWEKSQSMLVYERAIAELMDRGDFKEAAKVRKMFDEWLEDRGELDKEPERVEHSVDDEDLEFLEDVF
jgi:hypothetical protein